jgi:orotate phosphoribosyltransferase
LQDDVLSLLAARKGHFLLESGHHGDLWLDFELLRLRPRLVQPAAVELAERLSVHGVDAVCGPLVEGAFVGLLVAAELDVDFSYSERFAQPAEDGLFPAGYRIPDALHSSVRNKRVAIVSDVVNAGSAVRGTFAAFGGLWSDTGRGWRFGGLSLCKLSGVILCTLFGVLFEYGPTGGAYGRGQETRP